MRIEEKRIKLEDEMKKKKKKPKIEKKKKWINNGNKR